MSVINYNKRRKLYGVGVNDADYKTQEHDYVDGVRKTVWICPYYATWTKMLKRCYSENHLIQYPSYIGCTVDEEWLIFSNFRRWMVKQKWKDSEGNKLQLDKDLKVKGNKMYSEETCLFVDNKVNNFFQCHKTNSRLMVGVVYSKNKYRAQCRDPYTKTNINLGTFDSEVDARVAYLKEKLRLGKVLAENQECLEVSQAILRNLEVYEEELLSLGGKRLMS